MNSEFSRRNLIWFISSTFIIFLVLLGITGAIISLKAPVVIQEIMKNVCAWSPTFSIIILFRKLYPGVTVKEYLKTNFLVKAKASSIIYSLFLQVAILLLAVSAYLVLNQKSITSLEFIKVSAILPALIIAITSGATGEEVGWRGFMLQEFQKKYSLLISSISTGFIWGFWHFPLWLLSGYTGLDLLLYSITFMTSIVSFSVIISFFYSMGRNIFIAMWIHFLFNFSLKIVQIDILQLLCYLSIFLSFSAIVLVFLKRKQFL